MSVIDWGAHHGVRNVSEGGRCLVPSAVRFASAAQAFPFAGLVSAARARRYSRSVRSACHDGG